MRLRLRLINFVLKGTRRVAPRLEQRIHRGKWEHLWHVESRRPRDTQASAIPDELADAVRFGWFPPGCRILDIGCGRGQFSAWLAGRGFSVVGGDFTDEAVQLARRDFSEVHGRLEFRRLDIIHDNPEPGRFDALLDRGCLHTIRANSRQIYARNVSTWCRPGGKLLLLHRQDGEADRLVDDIRRLLGGAFELERHQRTAQDLVRSEGPLPRQSVPGIVFWLVRR